uniref:N-acetyltransferase domain-containing protein n=1 Tax=Alexandrium catenella TaxID=2925 RepID=A0A7S1WWR4_ALECA|mmetsp:Transcript_95698/g.254101  ORF Transcript_95698/g.254101 Transcript_95698/m.254101 type:complete len:216 (+) Transcript_95698:143-790(+)
MPADDARDVEQGSKWTRLQILADAEASPECRGLVQQAHEISSEAFDKAFSVNGLAGFRHLTLIVDTACFKTLGYCLYYMARNDGMHGKEWMLWIEQFAVLRECRGKGLGKQLMQWAIGKGRSSDCDAVRLTSVASAHGFYMSQGFGVEVCAGDRVCRVIKRLKQVRAAPFNATAPLPGAPNTLRPAGHIGTGARSGAVSGLDAVRLCPPLPAVSE